MEQIRIWDLYRLYDLILKQGGKIMNIEEIDSNIYKVTVSVKRYRMQTIENGRKDACDMKQVNVSWYDTQYIVLKPCVNLCKF